MSRVTLEETYRLDVRELHKSDVFDGGMFTWRWSRNGKPSGSIKIISWGEDTIKLQYLYGHGENQKEITQEIRITSTPCNYGGSRQWFICSNCSNRVGILSGYGERFYCRRCYRLPYMSQLLRPADRYQAKATKIKKRLRIKEAGSMDRKVYDFDRPKGMHRKTFDCLKNTANENLLASIQLWTQRFSGEVEQFFNL